MWNQPQPTNQPQPLAKVQEENGQQMGPRHLELVMYVKKLLHVHINTEHMKTCVFM